MSFPNPSAIRKQSTLLSVANPNRDGQGTTPTCFTGAAAGTTVEKINLKALVATTKGRVLLFLHDGTNFAPWKEIQVPEIKNISDGAFEFELEVEEDLPSASWTIRACTERGEQIEITITGVDYT